MTLRDWLFLGFLTRYIPYSITRGPNRGLRWSIATSRRFFRGAFEPGRVEAILACLRPDDCFWDIGAHYGYVTSAVARRLAYTGAVYAFEPSKRNLWFLRRHLRWNHLERVHALPLAVSRTDGEGAFRPRGSMAGKLASDWQDWYVRVPVRSVDSLVQSGDCRPPTFLKIDIEGGEFDLLQGGEQTFRAHHPLIMVAVHSAVLLDQCANFLRSCGYQVLEPPETARTRGGHFLDPDLIATSDTRPIPPTVLQHLWSAT